MSPPGMYRAARHRLASSSGHSADLLASYMKTAQGYTNVEVLAHHILTQNTLNKGQPLLVSRCCLSCWRFVRTVSFAASVSDSGEQPTLAILLTPIL
jgi:hypothetical protein